MFVEHKEQGEVTEAPAKVLKISEAIRIGCQTTVQGRDIGYIKGNAACAWGAAAIGMGGGASLAARLHRETGEYEFHQAFGTTVMTANDFKGWTRERIADALEKVGL